MSISSFDDLLQAARQQPEPQRAQFLNGEGGALVPGANGQRHSVRLHAHPASFIDGCCPTVKLPRNPEG